MNRILYTVLINIILLQPGRICNATNSSNFPGIYELDGSKFLSSWTTKHNFTSTKWSNTSFINLHIHATTATDVDTTVQLLILTHKFLHQKYLLHNAFANYLTVNSAIHSYNTWMRENLHLDSVSKNYGKTTVKYNIKLVQCETNCLPLSTSAIN